MPAKPQRGGSMDTNILLDTKKEIEQARTV